MCAISTNLVLLSSAVATKALSDCTFALLYFLTEQIGNHILHLFFL